MDRYHSHHPLQELFGCSASDQADPTLGLGSSMEFCRADRCWDRPAWTLVAVSVAAAAGSSTTCLWEQGLTRGNGEARNLADLIGFNCSGHAHDTAVGRSPLR